MKLNLSLALTMFATATLGGQALAQPGDPPPPPPPPGGGYYGAPAPTGPIREGLTFEANLGLGLTMFGCDNCRDTETKGSLGGLDLAVGGFLNPQTAILIRANGTTFSEEGSDVLFSNVFFGPSLQYWMNPTTFLGGGVGVGILGAQDSSGNQDTLTGLGLQARGGIALSQNADAGWTLSGEINISSFGQQETGVSGATATSLAVLIGWQSY